MPILLFISNNCSFHSGPQHDAQVFHDDHFTDHILKQNFLHMGNSSTVGQYTTWLFLVGTCQARLWFLGEVRIMINGWFSVALCFVHQYFLGTEVKGFFGVRNHYWIVPCRLSANHHYLHERQQRPGCHLIFSLEYKHALLLANISKKLLWLS